MKEILIAILCVFIFITIVLVILFHEHVRKFRKMLKQAAEAREARKQAEEDEYFKRTSNKHYYAEEKPKFKEGYFKSADKPKDKQKQAKKETTTRRTTQTGSGVTIIDDRDEQKADRKIFESGEGEYVDYVEVRSEE